MNAYDVCVMPHRRRKNRNGPIIKPQHRLELKGTNAKALVHDAEEEFGKVLQDASVKIVTTIGKHAAKKCDTHV